jgi:hypothetical protein
MADVEAVREKMRPVYIGRRLVGEMPEAEWLFIVAEVSSNRRLWEAQVKNLLRVAVRTLGFAFIGVPLGLFWTAVLLGWLGKPVFFPGAGEHIGALLGHPDLAIAGVALAVAAMSALGIKLGFVDYFAKARSALVKERLGLDQPGQATVR